MRKEQQAAGHAGKSQPRRDAEGARELEAMEDRDPSVTLMILKIASEFMAGRPS